jgi:hypothetical protein
MKRRYTFIIFFYVLGTASLNLIDLPVARFASKEVMADWAATRSVVMIGSTLVLFGLDQVMVRLPYQASYILRLSLVQIPILATLYVLLLSVSSGIQGGLGDILAVSAVALSLAQFGFYRAKNQLLTSQFANNSWRIILFAVIGVGLYMGALQDFALLIVISVVAATLLNVVVQRVYKEPEVIPPGEPETLAGIYALGGSFFVSLATLNIAVFMEQLMLNMTGQTEASALYFQHTALILPLLIPLNGLVGFLLGPLIRKDVAKFDAQLTRYWWGLPALGLLMSGVAFALSLILYRLFYSTTFTYDYGVAGLIILIGFLRIVYVLPSSYLGVTAEQRVLARFVSVNVLAVIVAIVSYLYLVYLKMNPVFAVAISSLLNWGMRTIIGLILVKKIWHKRKMLPATVSS